MTEMEKANLLASLIAHNERSTLFGERPGAAREYTAALRQALACMTQVHGIESELLRAQEKGDWPVHPDVGMLLLKSLRGYHSVGLPQKFGDAQWPEGEDFYLETIEEAMRCVETVYSGELSIRGWEQP